RGVDPREQPDHTPEQGRADHHRGRDDRRPLPQHAHRDDRPDPEGGTDEPTEQADHDRLEQELRPDLPARRPERTPQPDLSRALHDRKERDVRDPEATHEERDRAEREEDRVDVALHALAHERGRRRDLHLEAVRGARVERDRRLLGDGRARPDRDPRVHLGGAGGGTGPPMAAGVRGPRAAGACGATGGPAPTAIRACTWARRSTPKSARAVPSGRMTASSRSPRRATPSMIPITAYGRSPM